MKHLRIIGLAVLVFGALAASTARAEEGIFIPPNTVTGSGEGGTATLETPNKEQVSCTKVAILELIFTTAQKATANLHFEKCLAEGALPANSLGDASGIILSKVNVLVCLVEPNALVFGLLIAAITSPEHIEVPAVGQLVLVKGAVIAKSASANEGKEFKYSLKDKGGEQTEAMECEINKATFKHSLESINDGHSPDLKASEEAKFTVTLTKAVMFLAT
jgi:hypothetical protein